MSDEWTEADDVVEEVRRIRREIWVEFDNDPEKVMAYYMELDKQYADRMVDTGKFGNRASLPLEPPASAPAQ